MHMEKYTPTKRGFDEHVGYYQGCESAYTHVASCCAAGSPTNDSAFTCDAPKGKDFRGYDWFRRGIPDLSANQTNSATLIRDAAVDFISRQPTDQSFFLYLPFQNVHAPYTCDAASRARYMSSGLTAGEKTIFGYISELDDAVGAVVSALRAHGRYNHSVVVFSSDNGAPPAGEDVDHQVRNLPTPPSFHGLPWPFMAFRGIPWPSVAFHGLPWPSVAFRGLPWPSAAFAHC